MAVIRHANLDARGFNTRQVPTGPVELNVGHNLASGLNAAFFFGVHPTRDFSPYGNHITAITGVYTNVSSQLGAARNTTDVAARLDYGQGGVGNNTPLSQVFWGVPSRDGVLSGGKALGAEKAECLNIQFGISSITIVRQTMYAVCSVNWTGTYGTICQIVVTYNLANVCIYTNGVMQGSPTAFTNGFLVPGGANSICAGDPGDQRYGGDVIQFRTYTRALSATEVAQDYAEPFAILRPVKRRFYAVPTVAAPPTVRPRISMVA